MASGQSHSILSQILRRNTETKVKLISISEVHVVEAKKMLPQPRDGSKGPSRLYIQCMVILMINDEDATETEIISLSFHRF